MSHRAANLRQRFIVVFLADVEAAVFQHDELAGFDLHAIDPIGQQRYVAAQQLTQPFGHRRQRVFRLEGALHRAPQVAGDHHGRTGVQRQLDTGHAGTDAGVFGDAAAVVKTEIKGHVQVGANEDALVGGKAAFHHIGKTQDFHSAPPAEAATTRAISRHLLE